MMPYNHYKQVKLQWLTQIPEHWETKRVAILFDERKTQNKNYEIKTAFKFKFGDIVEKKQLGTEEELKETYEKYTLIDKDDIVINGLNLNYDFLTQRVGLVNRKGIITSAYISMTPRKSVNPKYACYTFKSMDNMKMLNGFGTGIRLTLSFSELKKQYLPVPPIEEQNQIVKFLDFKISKINKFIKDKKREIELLKETKQAEINHAVTKGLQSNVHLKDSGVNWLGEIPEHWEVRRLKKSTSLINQKGNPAGEKYIGLENIVSWTGKFVETATFNVESASNQFRKNDVLFGKLRPYLAKCIIAGFDGVCSSEILVLRGFAGNSSYLQNILLSYNLIYHINASTYGAKMPRASWTFIGNCPIPLPPLDEQQSIVNYLEKKSESINRLISVIEAEIQLAQEYKTSLINEVVTGKVDVRELKVSEDFEMVTNQDVEVEVEEETPEEL